jgi:hypothetical protein
MTVDGFCSFDKNPYCVCCTSKVEAVVTFYSSSTFIQFVTVGAQLTPSRKINMNHKCLGISYKDDKLYIANNAQSLYIHDMSGNELQKISTDSTGSSLFNDVREICFSDSIRGGVVADWNRGVIVLDDQYQRIAGYCDPELKGVSSACTDGKGSIFVCGYNSQNVLQIGFDGQKISDVVDNSHGIQYPESLCFDSSRCRLIITQGRSDIVKIIQMK